MTTVVDDETNTGPRPEGLSADYRVFPLGEMVLQCGITLRDVRLAYKTYGELNAARDNAVLMPTFFGGQHTDTELMMAPGRILDPARFFVIVPNLLGNGLSTSPSNTAAPFDGPAFPPVSVYDNVQCQHRLVTEHLGVERLRLVVGFSMGAQQALHWGALHPDAVHSIVAICGSARTSAHNRLLLEGARAALTAATDFHDGWYHEPPTKGLRAFSRVYGSLVLCSDFYRRHEYAKLGLASPHDTMRFLEGFFRQRDANDLLAALSTWQHADVSDNDRFEGDLALALGAVTARALVMPSETDFLFQVGDSEIEVGLMPNAELRPIPSTWGHVAGFGANPVDNDFVDSALEELLRR